MWQPHLIRQLHEKISALQRIPNLSKIKNLRKKKKNEWTQWMFHGYQQSMGIKSNISVILCDTYYIDKDVVKRKKSKRKKLSKWNEVYTSSTSMSNAAKFREINFLIHWLLFIIRCRRKPQSHHNIIFWSLPQLAIHLFIQTLFILRIFFLWILT